jgi:hypothetical protein
MGESVSLAHDRFPVKARAGSVSDVFPRFSEDESGREGSSLTLPALAIQRNFQRRVRGRIDELRRNVDD